MKVLIIDTDWRFAQQATNYLESHAHLVVNQNQREKAVTQLQHWQPDLVILSAELADQKVLEAVYSKSTGRPALLLTDHMDRFARAWQTWQKCGDELLMKPIFKSEELQEAIVAAMENAVAGNAKPRKMAASA